MRKETGRTRKIGELLQRELAMLVARELSDPRVTQVTLTAVDVAPDLSHAKVFITHLGGEEAALKAVAGLNHAAGFLQRTLRDRVILRKISCERHAPSRPSQTRGLKRLCTIPIRRPLPFIFLSISFIFYPLSVLFYIFRRRYELASLGR